MFVLGQLHLHGLLLLYLFQLKLVFAVLIQLDKIQVLVALQVITFDLNNLVVLHFVLDRILVVIILLVMLLVEHLIVFDILIA